MNNEKYYFRFTALLSFVECFRSDSTVNNVVNAGGASNSSTFPSMTLPSGVTASNLIMLVSGRIAHPVETSMASKEPHLQLPEVIK
jgi:hypothetical protein